MFGKHNNDWLIVSDEKITIELLVLFLEFPPPPPNFYSHLFGKVELFCSAWYKTDVETFGSLWSDVMTTEKPTEKVFLIWSENH